MDGSISDRQAPAAPGLTPQGAEPEQRPFDLLKIITIGRRRLPLMVGVALVVLALAVIFIFQQTPRYTADADVMIDTRKAKVVDAAAVMSGMATDSAAIETEVQVLRSRALAERVVQEQNLLGDPEFNAGLRERGAIEQILSFGRPAPPPRASGSEAERREREGVVDAVLAGLSAQRVGVTYVIRLSYQSESPRKASELANAFARAYLTGQLDAKFEATREANNWLDDKVAELRNQVISAETAVQQYKVSNNLLSAQGATLTEQNLTTLNQQLAEARAQQAAAQARLDTARDQLARGSSGEDVGEALNSGMVQNLRSQRSAARQKVAEMEGRYGERHPELLRARRELADLDIQVGQAIATIISNLEAEAQVARQRAASLAASAGQSRGALVGNNQAAVRLNELERNAESARTLYESYLNRFKEVNAQEGLESSDARIVSAAKTPGAPSYPDKTRGLLISLALALFGAVGAAYLAELLDSGLGTAEDVEQALDVAYLGSIPALGSTLDTPKSRAAARVAPADYVVEHPLSSFAEAFRNLRASVLFSRIGHQVKVIAITSSLPGEGKTTTSIALARTIAVAGAKTIVVDCDLRQRGLNRILPKEPEVGLLEVLNGSVPLERAMVADASGAWILPLAKSAYTPRDVFGTEAMKTLLAELKSRFDAVILDTAPVLPIADTRVLAPMADAVVLLVRWRKTPRKAAESALRLLKSVHAFVAGAAMTQVDLKAQVRYGYGDPGYYYRSYRKYYGDA